MKTNTSGALKNSLRQRAEEMARTEAASLQEPLSPEQMLERLHELRVHQIELEMQNEELRRTQHELEQSRARYFDLYDLAPVGYLTLNKKGQIHEANLAAALMLGVGRKDLLRNPMSLFIFSEDQDVYYLKRRQVFETCKLQEWEMRMVRSDGTPFWTHLQATPAQNGEYWISMVDITRHRQAEEALQKSENQYRTILHTLLDGFWVVDLQGRFIDVNEAYCTIIGYTRNEILGMSIQDVEALETRADIEQRMQKIFTAGTHRFESQHRCKDGHLVDLDICVSYLHDHARLCASLRDITGRNRAAEELRRSHDQLEQRVQERTRALEQANEQMKKVSFELVWAEERERERIAGELHDQVGQSLLLAKMKLDGLSDSIPSDSLRSYAEEASSLVENSIHDIRSLTFRMRPPILDTAGIQTALEWLCSSISNDYNLQVDFSDDGRPKPLTAEVSYALYQAARELLLNVVKHAGTKKAQLTLASDDHTLVVQVTDSGIGFDPPAATAGHAGSIGYGLYNVQQRIEQLGGRFAVESAPGRGTSVALMMPFAES